VTSGGDAKYLGSLILPEAGYLTPPVQVSDADGTVYYFSNPYYLPPVGVGYSSLPNYIEDRNGNQITTSFNSTNSSFTVTDTAGRAAITSNGFGPSGTTNTVSIAGMNYQVAWTTTTPNYSFPYKVSWVTTGDVYCSPSVAITTPETVISSITLPNGQQYKFYYGDNNPNGYSNPYGLLSEIDYPSGGWVRYNWAMSGSYSEGVIFDAQGECYAQCYPNVQGGCQFLVQTPVITTRTVGFGPKSSPALTQTFTYNTTWNSNTGGGPTWSQKTTTVQTTDNIRGLTSQTIYTYGSLYGGGSNNPYLPDVFASQLPVEQTTQYYNWSNTSKPIRTMGKTWLDVYDILTQTTTLNDGPNPEESEVAYTYTAGALTQPLTETKYDYGQNAVGPALQKTVWTYQTFATNPVGGVVTDKPLSVITYDGNNNKYAETDYSYDSYGSGITSVSATNHDNTNFPTSYTNRSNLTSKTVKCLQTGCANGVTTYTYDETGQVLSMTDPCGNATCADMTGTKHTAKYSYTDSYTVLSGGANVAYTPTGKTNASLTKATDPLGHAASFSYDYYSGQLTQATDPNSQSTSYIYNDPFSRPTVIRYPDQGQTSYVYNDSPYNSSTPSPSVTTTKAITSTSNEVSVEAFDGMGHSVETILSSDPEGPIYATSSYDGSGRIYQTSNPYRSTSDSTYGVTAYTYDALGRTTQVTQPDGTSVATSYGGRATSVVDEGNGTAPVQRISQEDGMGRLATVCEVTSVKQLGAAGSTAKCGQDIAGTGFLTTYQYDPLNDLLSVQQAAVGRTFTYDSLSHLLSAFNPESNTTSYTYDASGNLSTRIRPAPNQTALTDTITTTYTYDDLNRETGVAYSDSVTPSVTKVYDGTTALGLGLDNTIGRLSAEYVTASGKKTVLSEKVYSYDPMGRVNNNSQCTANNCASSTAYSITYTYNLLGQPATATNGQGVTFTYTYDAAARLATLTSSLSAATYPGTLLSGVSYSPFGAPTAATLGNALNEARAYDCRARILFYNSAVYPAVPSISDSNTPGCLNTSALNRAGETDLLRASLTDRLKRDLVPAHLTSPFLGAGRSSISVLDPSPDAMAVRR
jgi:YD repeat-containing protein